MKRLPRSLNQLERSVLAAIEKAGSAGLSDGAADAIFKKRLQRDRRIAVLAKLRGLNLITPDRSPGGGTIWRKHEPHESRAPKGDNRREPREGCVWRNNQWESAKPELLRSFTCSAWPSLSVVSCGKSIQFRNGRFCTSDPELMALLAKAHGYGTHILEDAEAVEIDEADQPVSAVAIHP